METSDTPTCFALIMASESGTKLFLSKANLVAVVATQLVKLDRGGHFHSYIESG